MGCCFVGGGGPTATRGYGVEHRGAEGVRGVPGRGGLGQAGKVGGILSHASYRGLTLIIKNLVASSLWNKLAVLNPPVGLFEKLQLRGCICRYMRVAMDWLT